MKIITRGHTDARSVKIKLADGSVVTGMINLIQRGDTEHRVSDIFVSRDEPFVVVFQADMGDLTNTVLVLNKHHIIWVMPDDGDAGQIQKLSHVPSGEEVADK